MTDTRFGTRVLWGLRWGLYYAAVLAAWITLIRLLRGTEPLERQGVTFVEVLVLYALGGPITGALVGILLPFTKSGMGAALVGIVAAIPVSVATIWTVADIPTWTRFHTFATIGMAVFGGAMCGFMFRAWLSGRTLHKQVDRSHR